MNALDRYQARLVALPLLANLVIAAMLLVLDRIRILLDFVATEGGPVSVVWKMLANLLPEYLGLGIPIGLLLGVLFAFRRLATSSELDVMRAVGISYGRLLRVPYMFAVLLALLNFAIVGFLQPYARFHYERLRFELRTGALGASIKVGEFAHFGDKMTIRIEKSSDEGRKLTGIFVEAKNKNGSAYAVNAERGQFLATDNPDEIVFRLTNGTLINTAPNLPTPRVLTFTSHSLPISLPKYENFRKRGGADLERTLPELARVGHDPTVPAVQRDASRAEFHFRMVEVVSMFLLPLLGLSLGVPPKRSTSVLGIFLSIVMVVTYHKVNQYMASIAALGLLNPVIALWGPFLVFAGLVIWMYYTLAYVPGGQPIGALERVFAKLGKALRRYLPKRRIGRIEEAQPA
jgi:lipopolysaccharide export system permease protein